MSRPLEANRPRYPDRRRRPAHRLRRGDYVHDGLVPMTIIGFEPAAAGSVRVVGRLASGTTMRAVHPATRLLDVTRMIPVQPVRPRGHLSLISTEHPS